MILFLLFIVTLYRVAYLKFTIKTFSNFTLYFFSFDLLNVVLILYVYMRVCICMIEKKNILRWEILCSHPFYLNLDWMYCPHKDAWWLFSSMGAHKNIFFKSMYTELIVLTSSGQSTSYPNPTLKNVS